MTWEPGNTGKPDILNIWEPGNTGTPAIFSICEPGNTGTPTILNIWEPGNTGTVSPYTSGRKSIYIYGPSVHIFLEESPYMDRTVHIEKLLAVYEAGLRRFFFQKMTILDFWDMPLFEKVCIGVF